MVVGEDKKGEMVNYRVKGSMYIVDRVFNRGVLLIGVGATQRKVTIARVGLNRGWVWPWQKDEFVVVN